jgi:hypothetical protein
MKNPLGVSRYAAQSILIASGAYENVFSYFCLFAAGGRTGGEA